MIGGSPPAGSRWCRADTEQGGGRDAGQSPGKDTSSIFQSLSFFQLVFYPFFFVFSALIQSPPLVLPVLQIIAISNN